MEANAEARTPADRVAATMPTPRDPGVRLDDTIPRHWFGGNAVGTHVANGVNLLFPAGERFFVRSVRHYQGRIEDPRLRAQVQGFFGQEGRHAREHERFFEILEAQGYSIAGFLSVYETLAFGVIERVASPALSLAVTAACEHYTALLAENALRLHLLDRAHPQLRALLLWHAAEEIEHRAVAFDVLQTVAPGYGLRVAGLLAATLCLGGFWTAGTLWLLAQERGLGVRRFLRERREVRAARRGHGVFGRGLLAYLRRDFHPSQNPLDSLAADYLASAGIS